MSQLEGSGGLFRDGPGFLVTADEESISTCPLLTPSPTGDFQDPLTISTTPVLEYDRQLSPSSVDTEASSCPPASTTTDFTQDNPSKDINSQARQRGLSDGLEGSSSSSSCSVMQDSTASAQLLNSRNYLSLASDVNCQENGGIKPTLVGLTLSKSTQEFGFTSWNWPVIRRWCFWGVMSITVACVCVIIGYISTIPTRCDPSRAWFQGALIYQVFPASFQDSDANGIGDFKGLASRTSYFESLGAKGLRLSYVFPAQHYPEHFDRVDNLTKIEPSLGTIDDFKLFVDALHARNISVILDLPIFPYFDELRLHDPIEDEQMVKHVIVNNHIMVSTINKTRGWGTGRGQVTEIMSYWLSQGVDGFYLIGLQHFINDANFLSQLHEWRLEAYQHDQGVQKVLLCSEEVVKSLQEKTVTDAEVKLNMVLKTFDLIDVRLDPFTKGTRSIKTQVEEILKSVIYSKPDYPWVYWTLGGMDSHRLASKAPFGNSSLAAILTSMALPGSSGLFYGDEIGLLDIHDPEGERADLEHAHGLGPMQWTSGNGGFTYGGLLSWLPPPRAALTPSSSQTLALMSQIRDATPPLYMHGVWTNHKLLPNTAIRYVDNNIVTVERTYPRRHSYLLVANLGQESVTRDLSSFYYGGEVVLDSVFEGMMISRYITFQSITLLPGQTILTKLDK